MVEEQLITTEEHFEIPSSLSLLLVFLHFAKKIEGKTKLQKLLFLGEKEYGINFGYAFEKYNYGPYSFSLTDDLNALERFNLINVEEVLFTAKSPFQGKIITFSLTDNGKRIADCRLEKIESSIQERMKKLISDWNSKPLKDIISYVYGKYVQ
jgi:hypothetical protein